MDKQKELKKLRTQKAKYKRQGNLKLVAEYANSIGNLCSEIGEHKQAIEEHECELAICEDLKDIEGEAIASRKLGECYMELVEIEPAKEYISKYIELAKTLPKKIELQRAFVTMGRLCLVEIPTLIPGTNKRIQSEKKAVNAFMKALEWCDKIKTTLNVLEYQEMRARAILNLGLLADMKNEEVEAVGNFTNASIIAKKNNLYGTYVTCLNNLADLHMRRGKFSEARSSLDEALSCNQKYNTGHTVGTTKLFAQVTVEMGDVGLGLDIVKGILRKCEGDERQELTKVAIKLYKIIVAKRKLPLSNDDDKRQIFEKIGDYCCDLGAYHHALLSYQKTLDIINQMEMQHDILAPILISMARTYQDLKNYDQAINYFCQEAKIQQQLNNYEQAAKSLLNVASCMENGSNNIEMICQCYKKAESHSRSAGDKKLQLLVLKNYRDSMKGLDYQDKYEECCKKVEQIKIELGLPLESQTEDESQNSGGEDGGESSDGGFELSDHSSDEERESETVKSTRCKPFKILRNELGETKLHQAVMKGKMELVIELLNKGHPVDIRDHAGWFPLHEAAIHNHAEIAKILVEHGSDINDRAGTDGVTPIHDACSSGCFETIQYLIEAGASVIAKDNNNSYPLDYLMNYLENSYEDLDEESKQAAEDIEAMLRSCMLRKGITPKPKLFKEQYQQKKDDIAAAMADVGPVQRQRKDSGDSVNSQPIHQSEPALSPELSATELYKSAVANVRKSAKRVAPPCAKDSVSGAEGPTLLRDGCGDNLHATGDWLIDDYAIGLEKKKQKRNDSYQPLKRHANKKHDDCLETVSSPMVIEETPEKRLLGSPDSNSNKSTNLEESKCPAKKPQSKSRKTLSISSSEPTQTPNDQRVISNAAEIAALFEPLSPNPSPEAKKRPPSPNLSSTKRVRKRLPSLSPIKEAYSQLTPAFEATQENHLHIREAIAENSGIDFAPNDSLSELLDGPTIFEKDNQLQDKVVQDENTARLPLSLTQDFLFDSEAETNICKSQKVSSMNVDIQNTAEVVDKENLLANELSVGLIGSSQKQSSADNAMETCELTPSASFNSLDGKSKRNKLKPAKTISVNSFSGKQSVHQASSMTKHLNVTKNDSSICNMQSAALPSSTPRRKQCRISDVSPIQTSAAKFDTSYVAPMRLNETKDSGFTSTSVCVVKPPVTDVLTGPVNPLTELNSSYHHNIRILVQWKNRVLLIPVSRCETRTIGWLSDELVRRLSKRNSFESLDASNIVLVRASDGAELFNEDPVSDILVDNEKVVAVNADEV